MPPTALRVFAVATQNWTQESVCSTNYGRDMVPRKVGDSQLNTAMLAMSEVGDITICVHHDGIRTCQGVCQGQTSGSS